MGKAKWWVCDDCKSLNDVPANKCYKCRTNKPAAPTLIDDDYAEVGAGAQKRVGITVDLSRLSELTARDPAETEDGAGIYDAFDAADDEPLASSQAPAGPVSTPSGQPPAVPAIRDPVPRGIAAVGGRDWTKDLEPLPSAFAAPPAQAPPPDQAPPPGQASPAGQSPSGAAPPPGQAPPPQVPPNQTPPPNQAPPPGQAPPAGSAGAPYGGAVPPPGAMPPPRASAVPPPPGGMPPPAPGAPVAPPSGQRPPPPPPPPGAPTPGYAPPPPGAQGRPPVPPPTGAPGPAVPPGEAEADET